MIRNFLILSCIGKNDKIGLKVNDDFFIHDLSSNVKKNDLLTINILNLIKKYKVNLNVDFATLNSAFQFKIIDFSHRNTLKKFGEMKTIKVMEKFS